MHGSYGEPSVPERQPQGGVSLQHGGWGSSDEAHRKHKEETGDNVEPLIDQEKRNCSFDVAPQHVVMLPDHLIRIAPILIGILSSRCHTLQIAAFIFMAPALFLKHHVHMARRRKVKPKQTKINKY